MKILPESDVGRFATHTRYTCHKVAERKKPLARSISAVYFDTLGVYTKSPAREPSKPKGTSGQQDERRGRVWNSEASSERATGAPHVVKKSESSALSHMSWNILR